MLARVVESTQKKQVKKNDISKKFCQNIAFRKGKVTAQHEIVLIYMVLDIIYS